MSIRMKEWGMTRVPDENIRIPVQGLLGWDSAVRGLGESVSALVNTTTELVKGQERVQETGELAQFSQRLHEIDAETRADLADKDVQDWDYAWRAACEPRLSEAVSELPPAARQAGADLAQAFSERASLRAFQDLSVQNLRKARGQWQQQVDNAVEQGDEQQARQWLENGRDVFVPQAGEEELTRQVCSRARLSRWQRDFSATPLQTLERWREASPEELPEGDVEKGELDALAQCCVKAGRQSLVTQATRQWNSRNELTAELWEQAHRAGLITANQLKNATGERRAPSEIERCRWFRQVDEVDDDEESRVDLQVEIATSPLPISDRKELMQRLDSNSKVLRADRMTLSRNLWNLYNSGAFGCPGDSIASRRMAALQRAGSRILSTQGAEATAAWVQEQGNTAARWVCFSDLHQTTA